VTALVGKTAYLNCRVRNLGNKTVGLFHVTAERACALRYAQKMQNLLLLRIHPSLDLRM
jgi:hypothetical protein